jgi:hypothetical protein
VTSFRNAVKIDAMLNAMKPLRANSLAARL